MLLHQMAASGLLLCSFTYNQTRKVKIKAYMSIMDGRYAIRQVCVIRFTLRYKLTNTDALMGHGIIANCNIIDALDSANS